MEDQIKEKNLPPIRTRHDSELDAVSGGTSDFMRSLAREVIKAVDFYCSTNDVKPICPIPIQM